MSKDIGNFLQHLFDGNYPPLQQPLAVHKMSDADVRSSDLLSVFGHSRPLGISPGFLSTGKLVSLAIADDKNCRIIDFQQIDANAFKRDKQNRKISEESLAGRAVLQENILCRPAGEIFAFDMAPLSMALHFDVGLRVTQAVDIQSAFPDIKDRIPLAVVKDALKDDTGEIGKFNEENIKALFLQPTYKLDDNERNMCQDMAMRAWLAQLLPTFGSGELTFAEVPRIDTKKLNPKRLELFSKLATDSLRLDSKKIGQTNTHQTTQGIDPTTGGLLLNSQNFNNKLRGNRELRLEVIGPHGSYTVEAGVAAVSGRAGSIDVRGNYKLTDKEVVNVTSIGPDGPTLAEAKRAATLLRALQGIDKSFDTSPWISNIWSPAEEGLIWPKDWTPLTQLPPPPPPSPAIRKLMSALPKLNASQQRAVNSMLSETDEHRITIIQGPPGTGKTSVIASYVHFSVNLLNKGGIWLIAQSNVAVKNIAEKLIATNFINWKMIVSKDFHFDWHEHIYQKIEEKHIIHSDRIFESTGRAKLKDTHVVLCTLSMLSNDLVSKFTMQIPLKTLVVDEASQIEIGNYIPVFSKFKSLRKMCFIGDDKQLPPHGQEDVQELKSIFEVMHLKNLVLFLDTQYRMPPQIGRIISKSVYDNQLKSNLQHPIPDKVTACYFLDVAEGKEQNEAGGSFKNKVECMAVLRLATKLQDEGKNYRIITPYAAQTSYIEDTMKERGLKWEDKCFNVDSFQGNEEDFIIISVVRSRALGFLTNLRRTNVMLSRCKKGMFIVSSKQFLTGIGANTLVGKFLKEMEPATWLGCKDIEAGTFLESF